MSAWGDTLTEQLAHDILMDQQHRVAVPLTPAAPPAHHRPGVGSGLLAVPEPQRARGPGPRRRGDGEYASWGDFDYRMRSEGFDDGYQSVPVNWGASSPRKKAFFKLLAEITGETP